MAVIDVPSATPDRPAVARPWLAYGLAGLATAAGLVGLGLGLRPSPETVLVRQNAIGSIATFGLAMSFTVVGLILRRSRVDNAVGWLLLLFGTTVGLSAVVWGVTYVAGLPGGDVALGQAVAWAGTILTIPTWTYLAVALIVRFPTGRPQAASDARLLRLSAVTCAAAGALAGLRPGPFLVYPSFSNPLELPAALAPLVTAASVLAVIAVLIPLTLAAWNTVARYRRAGVVERLQLRWFAYAATLGFAAGALYMAIGVLLAPDNAVLRESTYVLLIVAIAGLPIAVFQAITRHRLYDIDTIIGRTFAYGALTAILAGLYAASLRLFNAVFVETTGQTSEAALVLTTLVLATTFTPIKGRLERWAAHRFPQVSPPQAVATPAVEAGVAEEPGAPDLDDRIETIARRIALEVLAEAGEGQPRSR